MGYWGVFVLMTVQSSFIPFPSEIVVPPAAYLASQGKMDLGLIILFAVCGSMVGATINYYLAATLGRKVTYKLVDSKWAKFLFLDKENVEKAEAYFLKYGNFSTFICRLIPGIRQLISLVAGFTKMNFGSFFLYTFLGSGMWVVVLAMLGYFFGETQELYHEHYLQATIVALIFVAFMVIAYIYYRKRLNRKLAGDSES